MAMMTHIVLITGVSGFVGSWTALTFLQRGWTVRGTVRSHSKADHLSSLPAFKDYVSSGKLELTIIEDVATSDFGPALKGIQYFVHTASPCTLHATDNKRDFLNPAIKGTTNAIEAAHRAGVKHFGVTSSIAAVVSPFDMAEPDFPFNGKVYTDKDWNPATYEQAAASDSVIFGYATSKVLAEKAAWGYQEKHKLRDKMVISTVNPVFIFGPFVPTQEGGTLAQSLSLIQDLVTGKHGTEVPPAMFSLLCDVRDVAETHYQALVQNKTGRFLVSRGPWDNQLLLDIVHEKFPEEAKKYNLPTGVKGKYVDANPKLCSVDASGVHQKLGIQFQYSVHQTLMDTVRDIYKYGK